MDPTLEYLMKQHEHVFQSIVLADQKAAAITAISVGTIYVFYELMKASCFSYRTWQCVGGLAQFLLLLSIGVALWAIHPPVGIADRDVKGGEHTIPARVASLGQDDYVQWVVSAPADERHREVAAMVYSRILIRAWKYGCIQWSIWIMFVAFFLLLLLVGHFVGHTIRTRAKHTQEQPAHDHNGVPTITQDGTVPIPPVVAPLVITAAEPMPQGGL